jgi:hypothetical protein
MASPQLGLRRGLQVWRRGLPTWGEVSHPSATTSGGGVEDDGTASAAPSLLHLLSSWLWLWLPDLRGRAVSDGSGMRQGVDAGGVGAGVDGNCDATTK